MNQPSSTNWLARSDRLWPIVALLLLVVLLPSATVLWLTQAAVRNEHAAIRERLVKVYQQQLELAASKINEHWAEIDRDCASLAEHASNAELFALCVQAGIADTVLIIGNDGGLEYPASGSDTVSESLNERAWQTANRLEFVDRKLAVAADAYAQIAKVEPNSDAEARAWMAHARCLAKDGKPSDAIRVFRDEFNRDELRDTVDRSGRSVWVDAQLRTMQLLEPMPDQASEFALAQQILRETLQDYGRLLPSSQRLFAMQEFLRLCPDATPFPTLTAERLANEYAERTENTTMTSKTAWNFANDPRCVALTSIPVVLVFADERLAMQLQDLLAAWQTDDTTTELVFITSSPRPPEVITMVPLKSMPGRSLALKLNNPNLFVENSPQTALYTLAGLTTIAIVAVVAVVIALFVHQQLRLAQLKNDLAAVVTHELRTPLASIRVLVDTLLEGTVDDPQQQTEYLRLIARENARLSRLIENFLTFSRLQRHRQRFEFRQVNPARLVERAIAASGDKLKAPGCQFSFELANDLPTVDVDSDAFVMVLLNLLDNALKFSGPDKKILLSTQADDRFVTFAVKDNGIGMSPSDSIRGFERFYQADTRLSRNHGGCGLGLSLVRSIVHAHGGTVEVESAVELGSTFTVRLPTSRTIQQAPQSVTT